MTQDFQEYVEDQVIEAQSRHRARKLIETFRDAAIHGGGDVQFTLASDEAHTVADALEFFVGEEATHAD